MKPVCRFADLGSGDLGWRSAQQRKRTTHLNRDHDRAEKWDHQVSESLAANKWNLCDH